MSSPLNPSEGIAIFTDGSCYYADRIGGWAWIAIDAFGGEDSSSGGSGDTTSNRMEMRAAIEALNSLYTKFSACEVLVYSDSEYLVLGCNDPMRSRRKNPEMWHELQDAIDKHEYMEWHHVKGHQGNYYNEIADKMAGEARRSHSES